MANLSLKDSVEAWIEQAIKKDTDFKPYSSLLGLDVNSGVTVSGLTNTDYPKKSACIGGKISITKSLPLPYELIEKFSSMKDTCSMGTFVPCNRVWITIDNEFFMWDYETGEDLACFDQITDTIICVGFVTPPIDLFPAKIKHLLILSSLTEIVVLGVTYTLLTNGSNNEYLIDLISHPLYRVSNELLAINCIKAVPNGRVFFGTKDGSLLEFIYKPIPDWGPSSLKDLPPSAAYTNESAGLGHCSIINHSQSSLSFIVPMVLLAGFSQIEAIEEIVVDPVRCLLYTRTENGGHISAYHYGNSASIKESHSLTKIVSIKGSSLCENAYSAIPAISKDQFTEIVSIHPLVGYGDVLHLMAVTGSGIRFYLDSQLRLLHVRLPPTNVSITGSLNTSFGKHSSPSHEDKQETHAIGLESGAQHSFMDMTHHGLQAQGAASRMNFKISNVKLVSHNRGSLICVCTSDATSNDLNLSVGGGEPCSILCISPDPFPWSSGLSECGSCVVPEFTELPRNVWVLSDLNEEDFSLPINSQESSLMSPEGPCHIYSDPKGLPQSKNKAPLQIKASPPIVVTQHLDPPGRRFLLVSADGLVHITLNNPLQNLRAHLLSNISSGCSTLGLFASPIRDQLSSSNNDQSFLSHFLQQFGPDESICAAICLAAQAALAKNQSLQRLAEQTALYFAAESCSFWNPMIRRTQHALTSSMVAQSTRFPNIMEVPLTQTDQAYNQLISSSLFLLNGTILYLSRCIRTVWRSPMVSSGSTDRLAFLNDNKNYASSRSLLKIPSVVYNLVAYAIGADSRSQLDDNIINQQFFVSQLPSEDLSWLSEQLGYLVDYISRNSQTDGREAPFKPQILFRNHPAGDCPSQSTFSDSVSNHLASDAQLLGNLAVDLQKLTQAAFEIVSFWNILASNSIDDIIHFLTVDQQRSILAIPIEGYIQSVYSVTSNQLTSLSVQASGASGPTAVAVASDLVEALVQAYINFLLASSLPEQLGPDTVEQHRMNIDQFMQQLHDKCPSLFSNSSAQIAKAFECLQQAVSLNEWLSSLSYLGVEQLNLRSLASSVGAIGADSEIGKLIIEVLSTSTSVCDTQMYETHSRILDLLQKAISLFQNTVIIAPIDLPDVCSRLVRLKVPEAWICAARLCLYLAQIRDPTNLAYQCYKEGRKPSNFPMIGPSSKVGTEYMPTGNLNSNRNLKNEVTETTIVEGRYESYRVLLDLMDRLLELSCLPQSATDWTVDASIILGSLQFAETTSQTNNASSSNQQGFMNYLWKSPHDKTFLKSQNLNPPDPERSLSICIARLTLECILSDIFNVSDENSSIQSDTLAKYEVMSWLLQQGLTDRLMNLPSHNQKLLESYLRTRLSMILAKEANLESTYADSINLKLMLWRVLTLRNAHFDAAQVLESLALTPQSEDMSSKSLSLEDRVEYLARAIVSLKSLDAQNKSYDADYLRVIQDRLEAAELQQQMLHEILNTAKESPQDRTQIDGALHRLKFGPLLDLTKMFVDYAEPFELFESKLNIFKAANYQDTELIRAVWADLLKRHLESRSPRLSGDSRIHAPNIELNLVECLRRRYQIIVQNRLNNSEIISDSIYFPIGLILSVLERYAIKNDLPYSWVPGIIQRADIYVPSQLALQYDLLLRNKDPFWYEGKIRERIYSALLTVFKHFLQTYSSHSLRVRQYHAAQMIDLNSTLLVELQSGSSIGSMNQTIVKNILGDLARCQQHFEQII